MDFYSPLRYPGGKGKISDYIKTVYRNNDLYGYPYIEPYAGGASVGLSLLFNEYTASVSINDVDLSIYAFWYSILNNTEEFIRKIYDIKLDIDEWKKQKEIQGYKNQSDLLDLGISTFYLNRTNRSGIISAGVIGGYSQSGNWKIDARFNKKDLIRRIERIARYKDNISVSNLDAVQLVSDINKQVAKQKSFLYLDPPYYVKGKELYLNYYKHDDHVNISKAISKVKNPKWIVSYDNNESISKMYTKFRTRQFHLNYSAGNNTKGLELMVFSNNLLIPDSPIFN